MATTAGGTPYVESSDLVADYPTISLALAEHIDDLPSAVLQVVRATDVTDRSTTSTSFVDASISVTITPQKSDSNIVVIWTNSVKLTTSGGNEPNAYYQITDSANASLSGAQSSQKWIEVGINNTVFSNVLFAYATPGSTAEVTYKGRHRVNSGVLTSLLQNAAMTGQMYAIEVAA